MSDNISILGLNIKRIREDKKISAYRLAKDANVGAATISQIESGKRQSLNSATVEKIANTLGVSSDELLATENNVEYIVTDVEQTISLILTSDELVLDDIEMTKDEKNQLRMAVDIALNSIRSQRSRRDDK
ncbi:helix-turn-helix family protein [Clostridium argentinense CDC 2741]|uniref:Helix-turn-helix family protein n=1 Tax=Clostridium argentinense CDC 2741 TaxID=1418104 RepID=A0A0C1R1F0_9CLOT|nr:helix-turn-helix transcriptional regulator [Clostridium argentinense]ARC85671.1 transcriptional regulator [Clostridium argentinense]KIE47217.1 helix-turn-helix family protein [Clostridium argentinense CDC 2741]NFF40806.1 helix-turn-helix transcriptional regulator [Clostridium argentinense]NFP50738.1 helix-turn-helix transcriptional regulator [Clostridium argentinense]NFP73105.1 helix-turn-helix transcriptional regulator [Clostridium argentinense]